MKATRVGLCYVWLYGFMLIVVSLFLIQSLPFKDATRRPLIITPSGFSDVGNPKITIFSALSDFAGERQSLAIRSWLALSSQITVVLFTKEHFAASFASVFDSRVLIDSSIDFTFLGTPLFHSMVERSQEFETDISVFVNPETVLLSDFVSTLYYAHKLDRNWLLVASLRNVSYFPFHLDDSGRHWLREDGKRIKLKEVMLSQDWQWNDCDDRMLMAWNSQNVALHNAVLPPFIYSKGIHNRWIINEAVLSENRFVFDASWTISCFYLSDHVNQSNHMAESSGFSNIKNRSWEYVGNSHLGAAYGSLLFQEVDYSSLLKLVKCDGKYLFSDTKEDIMYPFMDEKQSVWSRRILHSRSKKKNMACVGIKSKERMLDCSLRNQLKYLAPLDIPLSLESLLSVTADENQTVVLGVAGYSYKDMLMSWVCRLRRLQVTNFLVCALDQETYQFSVLQGLPVFYDPSAPSNISFNDCHFGTKCFQRVTKVKSRLVLKILKLGYNVLLSDVDVYWFSNPLPVLSSFGPAVLLAQSDEYNKAGPINLPRRLNSGFYFARSDASTIAAVEKVMKHAASSGLSEQPSFYDILCGEGGSHRIGDDRCVEPETNLTVHFLDRNLFPNGAYLDIWKKHNVKEACAKVGCLVLHNNWISGRMKKLERQFFSAMLKACVCLFGHNQDSHKESGRKEEIAGAPMSYNFPSQSREFSVRIVHAGGREELYQHKLPASHLMEKYPGMYVARPEVFKNPQQSLLRPDENLLPGHKYLMIPSTTAQKLRHKHVKGKLTGYANGRNDMSDVNITWEASKDISDVSVSSAKDFYTSKERSSRDSKRSMKRRSVKPKKDFVPPLPKTRIYRGPNWEPSLTSVQELSP